MGWVKGRPWDRSMASPSALSRLASMSTSSEKMPLCISVNAMMEPTKPQPMTAAF